MTIALYIILSVSVLGNIYLFFYSRFLIKNLWEAEASITEMKILFDSFKEHVDALHESEMFYGDDSLQLLIKHSKFVLEEIEKYDEKLNLEEEYNTYEEKEEE